MNIQPTQINIAPDGGLDAEPDFSKPSQYQFMKYGTNNNINDEHGLRISGEYTKRVIEETVREVLLRLKPQIAELVKEQVMEDAQIIKEGISEKLFEKMKNYIEESRADWEEGLRAAERVLNGGDSGE